MTTARLRQLRFESKVISMVAKMVEHHLRPAHMMQGVEVPTGRAIHRYFRDVGTVAVDTLYLCQADFLAAKGPELKTGDWAGHARMIAHVVHTGFQPASSSVKLRLIDGNELMQHFKLDAGPLIGRLLECMTKLEPPVKFLIGKKLWLSPRRPSRDIRERFSPWLQWRAFSVTGSP